MKLKRHYYLMISCPGDVIHERKLLKECVENINNERSDDVWVELQYWATDTSSDAGVPAQDSINQQIVNECDGLIAIFNARLGTPVHDYKCGTDEEISLMLQANKHVSLLFNTKPTIDLSNATSIEQITRLQEYKNEQTKKAYYREFSDSESFVVLARREILMWLRNIANNEAKKEEQLPQTALEKEENNDRGNEKEEKTDKKEKLPTKEETIDTEAGVIDCVVYITNAATELTDEITDFYNCINELTEITNSFNDKINFLKKQNKSNSGVLLACRQYAKEINLNGEKSSAILDKMELKWDEIYQYTLIYNKNTLNHEDKIILKDSISSLRQCFEETIPKIDSFLENIFSFPNIQKEVKKSLNSLSEVYKRFRLFTIQASENCEELEAFFEK